MRKTTTILAAVAAATTVLFAACETDTSSGSGSAPEQGKESSTAAAPNSKAAKPKKPKNVYGDFKLLGGVKVEKDFGGSFSGKLRVTNVGKDEKVAMFKVTLLRGENLVGSMDCIGGGGSPVAAGATTTAECISTDKFAPYKRVELEYTGF